MTAALFVHLTKIDMGAIATAEQLDGNAAWSSEFAWKEIEQLALYTSAYKAKKGTLIVSENDRERYMGIILAGQLEVSRKGKDGKNKVLATITRGKTFGEMSLLDDDPRSATLKAAVDSTLLMITQENVTRMSDENPRVGFKFMLKVARLLSQRLRQTSGMLADHLPDHVPAP